MLLSHIAHFFAQASLLGHRRGPQPCEGVAIKPIPGIEIHSLTSHEVHGYESPYTLGHQLDFCDVTVLLSHQGEDDQVQLSVWLPFPEAWNGRFLATGGGGLATGYIGYTQPAAVIQGYAAAATEGGLTLNNTIDPQSGQWALRADGSLNRALLQNYAHRSIHDLAVVGKAVTQAFYGRAPRFSYWNGCSTGGRQGIVAAALYPRQFNGILAASPGIYQPDLFAWFLWPPLVMLNNTTTIPPQCVFSAFQQAILATCDGLDGVVDGLISAYREPCPFNPASLINTSIGCPETNSTLTITAHHAALVQSILAGPVDPGTGEQLWYGLPPGASFRGTADTITVNRTTQINPFLPATSWLRHFLLHDPTYNISTLTMPQFLAAVHRSRTQFGDLLTAEQHHTLDKFQQAGGRLLAWHGLADEIIPAQGTIQYREAVERAFQAAGRKVEVDDFFRLFLAPGAGHCGGTLQVGYGPVPVDALGAVVRWVEEGVRPDTLFAEVVSTGEGGTVSRGLCRWPGVLKYDGQGDVDVAGSFVC
ncbi:feruloyl esterase, partial [Aspergillus saccharolyticus JOP 1030-1]